MDDIIDEELKIMKEQDAEPTTLSSDTFNHPISDLNLRPVIPLDVSSTIQEAIEIMQKHKFGAIIVTKDSKLEGIFTERDLLLKVVGKICDLKSAKITEVMTKDPLYLHKEDKIAYVMNNMHVGGFRHIPIVNDDKEPVSVVSIKSVNSYILDHFPASVTNITGRPYRGPVSREGA